MSSSAASIHFLMGNAQSPSSPWGRDELDIGADGGVAYRNQRGGLVRTVTGKLTSAATTRLFAAFAASPFPQSPDARLQPGGSACELRAGDATMVFDYHTAMKPASGYAELVKLLTGWTGLLRTPANRVGQVDLTDLVDVAAAAPTD